MREGKHSTLREREGTHGGRVGGVSLTRAGAGDGGRGGAWVRGWPLAESREEREVGDLAKEGGGMACVKMSCAKAREEGGE